METNSYVLVRDFWLERNLWMPGSVKDLLVEVQAIHRDLVLFPLPARAHLIKIRYSLKIRQNPDFLYDRRPFSVWALSLAWQPLEKPPTSLPSANFGQTSCNFLRQSLGLLFLQCWAKAQVQFQEKISLLMFWQRKPTGRSCCSYRSWSQSPFHSSNTATEFVNHVIVRIWIIYAVI